MRLLSAIATLLICVAHAAPASAVDTNETIDSGATYYEFSTGWTGLQKPLIQQQIYAGSAIAYGLTDKLTGYLAMSGQANAYFGDGFGRTGFGLMATVYNTDHVSVDAMIDAGMGGVGPQPLLFHPARDLTTGFALTPGVEINYDHDDEMNDWGLFTVLQQALTGRTTVVYTDEFVERVTYAFAPYLQMALGGYITTVADKKQWLLELDFRWRQNPTTSQDALVWSGLGLGYNHMVNEELELATEVYVNMPVDNETWGVGFSVGIIRW